MTVSAARTRPLPRLHVLGLCARRLELRLQGASVFGHGQVLEETGYDIRSQLREQDFLEIVSEGKRYKLYIVTGLDPTTQEFEPHSKWVRGVAFRIGFCTHYAPKSCLSGTWVRGVACRFSFCTHRSLSCLSGTWGVLNNNGSCIVLHAACRVLFDAGDWGVRVASRGQPPSHTRGGQPGGSCALAWCRPACLTSVT